MLSAIVKASFIIISQIANAARSYLSSLYFCQHVLKDFIVVLHSVIQVDPYHLVSKVMDFFFVNSDFFCLSLQRGQLLEEFHPFGSGRAVDALFQICDSRPVSGLLLMDIVRANTGNRVRLIAVHVNLCSTSFEGLPLTLRNIIYT